MIVTVKIGFVDNPKGRDQKVYNTGDVVDISASDYERITEQSRGRYLKKGNHRFGSGVCYPCQKKKDSSKAADLVNEDEKTENKTTVTKAVKTKKTK